MMKHRGSEGTLQVLVTLLQIFQEQDGFADPLISKSKLQPHTQQSNMACIWENIFQLPSVQKALSSRSETGETAPHTGSTSILCPGQPAKQHNTSRTWSTNTRPTQILHYWNKFILLHLCLISQAQPTL